MSALAELFPSGDFRHHLTLRRGEPRTFFAAQDPTGAVLRERRRWVRESPERYARLLPEGGPLLAEFSALCASWGLPPVSDVAALGEGLEPDVLLLSPDDRGEFRLRGGALCFPTGWALEEKIGGTMEFIHGVVPGLNTGLGAPIQQFMQKLKPGVAFLRDNWGLAASSELNLHPHRAIAPPHGPVALERLWLRVEHQALMALPEARGVVFGIRIALHRLDEVRKDIDAGQGLARALEIMPAEMAAYKKVADVRAGVIRRLRS